MLFRKKEQFEQQRIWTARSLTGERGGLLVGERGGEALERVVVALRQRRPPLLAARDNGRQHLQVVRLHRLQVAAAARRAPHVDDIRLMNRQHHQISKQNSASLMEQASIKHNIILSYPRQWLLLNSAPSCSSAANRSTASHYLSGGVVRFG